MDMDNTKCSKNLVLFKKLIKVVLIVILLLLVAGVGYGLYQQYEIQAHLKSMQQANELFSKKIGDVQTQQGLILAEHQKTIQSLLRRIGEDHIGLVFIQVEYLVKQANLSLDIQHDFEATIKLLTQADKKLYLLDQTKLQEIHIKIQNFITDLKTRVQVDTLHIYQKLRGINDRIDALPLVGEDVAVDTAEKVVSPHRKDYPKWKSLLMNGWDEVKQVFVVRKIEQPISPVLSAQQRDALNLHIHSLLSRVELSLLQKQGEIYTMSLKEIGDLIKQYFAPTNESVKKTLEELTQLQQIKITEQLPDIRVVIQAVQEAKKILGVEKNVHQGEISE
jgi:uroporphyrin-III C-methyltransferase